MIILLDLLYYYTFLKHVCWKIKRRIESSQCKNLKTEKKNFDFTGTNIHMHASIHAYCMV